MWYKFLKDEFKLETKKAKELDCLYSLINKTFISRCFFTKGYVLVSKTPTKITRNETSLHSISQAAIQFQGGYNMYYSNGVKLEKKVWESIKNKTYTLIQYSTENNEEKKSAIIMMIEECYGPSYLLEFLGAKKIDTYINKKDSKYLEGTTGSEQIGVYTLFATEKMKYVRCFCPSTDRVFHLEVEPHYNDAKNAIASLLRIPTKLKSHIKSIRRQGERFSIVWTIEGKEIKNTLKESDWQDLKPVRGKEYFELMEYEY